MDDGSIGFPGTLHKILGFGILCKFFKIIWCVHQVRFHHFPWCHWNPNSGDQLPILVILPKSGFDSGDQFLIHQNRAPDSGNQLPILAIRTDLDLRHDLLVKKQHACEIKTVANTYTGYSFFYSQKLAEAQNSQQVTQQRCGTVFFQE